MRRRAFEAPSPPSRADSAAAAKSSWRKPLRHVLRRIPRLSDVSARTLIATVLLALACLLCAPLHLRHIHRAKRVDTSPPPRRCVGPISPLSATAGVQGLALVNVGPCTLQFHSSLSCPPRIAGVASALRFPFLPCRNASLRLDASHSGRILRAFGISSRSSPTLPLTVPGVLLPASAAPAVILHSPDPQPYFWESALPAASACSRDRCRSPVRAMLLAYLSGCGALHDRALWRLQAVDASRNARGGVAKESLLLAFPRGCSWDNAVRGDAVAEDILSRYLRATCEVPSTLPRALPALAADPLLGSRARFIIHATGVGSAWWRRKSSMCPTGMQFYEYDAWEGENGAMHARLEMGLN